MIQPSSGYRGSTVAKNKLIAIRCPHFPVNLNNGLKNNFYQTQVNIAKELRCNTSY